MKHTDNPRILICRLSALGDCVHTMPLVCALRRRYPRAHIAWLTQSRSVPLIRGHLDLDELLVVERGYLRSPTKVRRLRKDLLARRFDVAIDAQSLTKSALPAWLSGARTRIGFVRGQGREIAPSLNNHLVRPESLHVVDKTMELLRPLGIEHEDVEFKLPVDAAALASVEAMLTSLTDSQSPVVMHPGASWDSKVWPHLRYAEVAAHLGARYGVRTIVPWAGEAMRRQANEIAERSSGQAVAAPGLSLPELVALLSRAQLFVGSDSGPLHMAAALDTPTVSMFGPTQPERNGPYRQGHAALQAFYQVGTTRQRKRASNEAMRAISAATVIEACAEVLDVALPPRTQASEQRPMQAFAAGAVG